MRVKQRHTLSQSSLAACWGAQNCRATAAHHYALGVAEDCRAADAHKSTQKLFSKYLPHLSSANVSA